MSRFICEPCERGDHGQCAGMPCRCDVSYERKPDPPVDPVQEARALEGAVVQAARESRRLENRLVELQGALSAQDERERLAGEKCGVPAELSGCDWPDTVAEKMLGLRARVSQLEAERNRLLAWNAHLVAERDRFKAALIEGAERVRHEAVRLANAAFTADDLRAALSPQEQP